MWEYRPEHVLRDEMKCVEVRENVASWGIQFECAGWNARKKGTLLEHLLGSRRRINSRSPKELPSRELLCQALQTKLP